MAQPNLLFLMTDHQRADSIGMRQCGMEVCPNLNRLASESVAFDRAYTTSPICVPARTALATGKYPTKNGVVFNDWKGVRAQDHKPMHQHLAEAGYQVAHVGVHHVRVDPPITQRVPFAKFAEFYDHPKYLAEHGIVEDTGEGMNPFRRMVREYVNGETLEHTYSSTTPAPWPHDAKHFRDFWFAREAVDFLENCSTDKPFALFVTMWAPHPPLRVPEPYFSMFDPKEIDLPANVGCAAEGQPAARERNVAFQLGQDLSLDDWRRVWAAHLGLVRMVDDALGQVLQKAEAMSGRRETVTLFTVDHGDHLGQRQMYQKFEMYEQALRVPLMIRGPGVGPCAMETPVSHLDVMPTLFDALGLDTPSDLDGVSLWDAARRNVEPDSRPVFAQYSGNPDVGEIRRAVIDGKHKYVYDTSDERELYDLEADPLEMNNLADDPAHADLVARLHNVCAEWHRAHGDWVEY